MKSSVQGSFGRAAWLGVLGLLIAVPACASGPSASALAPRPLPPLTAAPVLPPAALPALGAPLPGTTSDLDADPDADPDALGHDPDHEHGDAEGPDDEDETYDATPQVASVPTTAASPLLALSDTEIHARFRKDPASLGALSVGKPNAGALVNGVNMPKGTMWTVLEPGLAWGTQETIDGLSKAIERVNNLYPGSQAIPIGHISSKSGGYLPVHKSHQAGRDVDVGYYFTTPKKHFVTGNAANLDLARTLAFVKSILAVSTVEMILVDTSIQKLLADHAIAHGDDPAWVDRTFQVRQKMVGAPVRHVRGHKNHLHIRFSSPTAVALGRRVAGLVAVHAAPPPGTPAAAAVAAAKAAAAPADKIVSHRAKSGDTLVILARRYGTTVEAIQRVNHIKGTALKAGHVYQIPVPPPPVRGAPLPPPPQKHAKKGKTGG